jgi:hypothetical protein
MLSTQSPRDRHAMQPEPRPSPPEQGQVVMGPGFYVWDESPKEAREWGTELATAWLTHSR